jgi:hypothetical protein
MSDGGRLGRFSLDRALGEGSFGIVWAATDTESGHRVALKQLRHLDPGSLLRFKREFRALADIHHPNLVRLGELTSHDDSWFFTLELVDGEDLLDHTRPPMGSRTATSFNEARLRAAFRQLAEGLSAIHRGGLLHRDLKPSNVMVTRDARVVILDFGMVRVVETGEVAASTQIVGTPAYMSPEQGLGGEIGPPSDWYAVGVMLFEALTGMLPFKGNAMQMVFERNARDARPPSEIVEGVPKDLDALCRALLTRDPKARAGAADVLAVFGNRASGAVDSVPARAEPTFVGRETELAIIRDAVARVRTGNTAVVHVRGLSGMGKSALARQALREISTETDAITLSARCYPRESVPYKALDGVIDDLSRRLARMPEAEAARYLPRDWDALTRLFPVLQDVKAGANLRRAAQPIRDAAEVRRRAVAALRDLLGRLGDRCTVAVHIDDLQWGDHDSGLLIRELLRGPDAPRLLFLASYRSDEVESSPLLQLLQAHEEPELHTRMIEIGSLPAADARALAAARLGTEEVDPAKLDTLVKESAGSPFLLEQLASTPELEPTESARSSLERLVGARLARLPENGVQIVYAMAIAGGPLQAQIACSAAGFAGTDNDAIGMLEKQRWIRRRAGDSSDIFEVYHDRLRETVVRLMPADDQLRWHRQVAEALEVSGVGDPETLAEHYLATGLTEPAARHALRAADLAARALAFDRAARLYEMALSLRPWAPEDARAIRIKLGDANVGANRGEAAARAYLAAAEGATPDAALALRSRACGQLLISGILDEGLGVAREVLAMVGVRYRPTQRSALMGFLARHVQLRLRGLHFSWRAESEIDPAALRRVDTCREVALGMGMVDVVRAAHIQQLHLLYALRAGDPRRVARALIQELGTSAAGGSRTRSRTQALRERAHALASELRDPYISSWLMGMDGIAHFLDGVAPLVAHEMCAKAIDEMREKCSGVMWEIETTQLYRVLSLAITGRVKELEALTIPLLEDAKERKDLYFSSFITTRIQHLLLLAADDPVNAERAQAGSLAMWPRHEFQIQHYWDWYAKMEIALYRGDAEGAWRLNEAQWRDYQRSLTGKAQSVHEEALFTRGRIALARAAQTRGSSATEWLERAAADARRLDRERNDRATVYAMMLRALATDIATPDLAPPRFAAAEEAFMKAGMENRAMTARWRRGRRVGGEEGTKAVNEAITWMQLQHIRNPVRTLQALAPGEQT